MLDTPISTEQWLRQELDFINTTMSHTLNGQLKAAFVSCNEETQELTLEFPLEGCRSTVSEPSTAAWPIP